MNPRQLAQLEALVALKRGKAEQEMLALQTEIHRIETGIAEIAQRLQDMDMRHGDDEEPDLARRYGHDRRLILDLAARRTQLAEQQSALEVAREALKRAVYSEDRLGDITG